MNLTAPSAHSTSPRLQDISAADLGTPDDRLAVKPRKACEMLSCGMTRLYELMGNGEIQSFRDGRSRKVLTSSIRAYIARRIAAGTHNESQAA